MRHPSRCNTRLAGVLWIENTLLLAKQSACNGCMVGPLSGNLLDPFSTIREQVHMRCNRLHNATVGWIRLLIWSSSFAQRSFAQTRCSAHLDVSDHVSLFVVAGCFAPVESHAPVGNSSLSAAVPTVIQQKQQQQRKALGILKPGSSMSSVWQHGVLYLSKHSRR